MEETVTDANSLAWPAVLRIWWSFYWKYLFFMFIAGDSLKEIFGSPTSQAATLLLPVLNSAFWSLVAMKWMLRSKWQLLPEAISSGNINNPSASSIVHLPFRAFFKIWWSFCWRWVCLAACIFYGERLFCWGVLYMDNPPERIALIIMNITSTIPASIISMKWALERQRNVFAVELQKSRELNNIA